jgi:queuine tRNA-ribosyltransferase
VERSFNWLLYQLIPESRPPNLFVQLVGGSVAQARTSFAKSILEPLDEKERFQVPDLKNLDEGVAGYSFDLVPICASFLEEPSQEVVTELLQASLHPLPETKPRLVNGTKNPHQVLRFIQNVGIDLFDVQWAFDAAQWGIALDFAFPAQQSETLVPRSIGHNLYSDKHVVDDCAFADAFRAGILSQQLEDRRPICPCLACSPTFETHGIDHSPLASELFRSRQHHTNHPSIDEPTTARPITRAYLHHLLHTHEMLAHVLLVSHNLAVAEAFFQGIRNCLAKSQPEHFEEECATFNSVYSENGWTILAEGKQWWLKIDKERGKGRLARENSSNNPIEDT